MRTTDFLSQKNGRGSNAACFLLNSLGSVLRKAFFGRISKFIMPRIVQFVQPFLLRRVQDCQNEPMMKC